MPRRPLVTVAKPTTDYPGDSLWDMEAAGFFPTALRFSTLELVHCFKVVSDNLVSMAQRDNSGLA